MTLNWTINETTRRINFGRLVPVVGNWYDIKLSGVAEGKTYHFYVASDDAKKCLASSIIKEDGGYAMHFKSAALREIFKGEWHEARSFHAIVTDSVNVIAEGDMYIGYMPVGLEPDDLEVHSFRGPKGDTVEKFEYVGRADTGDAIIRVTMSSKETFEFFAPIGPRGYSEYDLAVQSGYTGTLTEWLSRFETMWRADYEAAERERDETFAANEGTKDGSAAGDGSRWGAYKAQESARAMAMETITANATEWSKVASALITIENTASIVEGAKNILDLALIERANFVKPAKANGLQITTNSGTQLPFYESVANENSFYPEFLAKGDKIVITSATSPATGNTTILYKSSREVIPSVDADITDFVAIGAPIPSYTLTTIEYTATEDCYVYMQSCVHRDFSATIYRGVASQFKELAKAKGIADTLTFTKIDASYAKGDGSVALKPDGTTLSSTRLRGGYTKLLAGQTIRLDISNAVGYSYYPILISKKDFGVFVSATFTNHKDDFIIASSPSPTSGSYSSEYTATEDCYAYIAGNENEYDVSIIELTPIMQLRDRDRHMLYEQCVQKDETAVSSLVFSTGASVNFNNDGTLKIATSATLYTNRIPLKLNKGDTVRIKAKGNNGYPNVYPAILTSATYVELKSGADISSLVQRATPVSSYMFNECEYTATEECWAYFQYSTLEYLEVYRSLPPKVKDLEDKLKAAEPMLSSELIDNNRTIFAYNPITEFGSKVISLKRDIVGNKKFVIAHISDIHSAWINFARFNEFCEKFGDNIDMRINTGDNAKVNMTEDFSGYHSVDGVEKVLFTPGNHDTYGGSASSGWQAKTARQVFDDNLAPYIDGWGVTYTDGLCYYYKDIAACNLRIIVIDAMHYDDDQHNWLVATLASAKGLGYACAIFAHFVGSEYVAQGYGAGYAVPTNSDWTTFAPSGYSRSVDAVQAFQDDGGKFVAWFVGHLHSDKVYKIKDHNKQFVVAVSTSYTHNTEVGDRFFHYYESLQSGTKLQDSFAIYAICTGYSTINILKVGRNIDVTGKEWHSAKLNYYTGNIVFEN